MFRGDTLLILGHGVKCPGQLWPLARGWHALRCLVTHFSQNTAVFYDKHILLIVLCIFWLEFVLKRCITSNGKRKRL